MDLAHLGVIPHRRAEFAQKTPESTLPTGPTVRRRMDGMAVVSERPLLSWWEGGSTGMTLIARLAGRVLGGESPARCLHCRFDNAPGATSCQVCGTVLGGTKCSKCDMVNPSDATVCGLCGFRLLRVELALVVERTDLVESVAPRPSPARADSAAEGPSPAALIGFGAVLSLAAAAYPWYLFGGFEVGAGINYALCPPPNLMGSGIEPGAANNVWGPAARAVMILAREVRSAVSR